MLREQPLVSIVVPVYNQEAYLDSSVKAILHQTYRNIEVILVNDGSTDGSSAKLQYFDEKDDRVVVIDKSNGGLIDATITGIRHASGEYIAFVDPDDYVGTDYIANFVQALDPNTDVVAAGFYHDDRHRLKAFPLKEDKVYKGADISVLREHLLNPDKGSNISSYLSVSRWNKMYRTSCVKNIANKFEQYKGITLGEDTIFTYLILLECNCVRTLSLVNSYYYNVASSGSMMKNSASAKHQTNAAKAQKAFARLLVDSGLDTLQADILYYFLIESLLTRLLASRDRRQFISVYGKLRKEQSYMRAVKSLLRKGCSRRELVVMNARVLLSPGLYYWLMVSGKSSAKKVRDSLGFVKSDIGSLRSYGIHYTRRMISYRKKRNNAFDDIENWLPEIEKRVMPMLSPFIGKVTDLEACPVENNVFVFWWDGFDSAPAIVRECLDSVKRTHPDASIIELSKNNYEQFTDIDVRIRQGFADGDISVQTFSDILRFNVLKNNGGTWVDATLYFAGPYDLTAGLIDKSFESLNCNTTPDFLKYDGYSSTWTGFFIAARKHSLFVTAMDAVFKEYFLKYGEYPIYLFIDAVFMICLKHGLDGDVLNRIHKSSGYLFEMIALMRQPYHRTYLSRLSTNPQKLSWFFNESEVPSDSVYKHLFSNRV
ncbi:glycosyltransferase [Bifidobacterium tissieri]|uniref:Glycosyltransferase n=1 Tax=Bifidobacterium tissieri TaxID=1630162 RepID=A0A5M9ZI20_9BIFI|nr:capsular polysaccharide synthesis protein [Bifidobacterium tissieri]KAA8827013.1 glycosyltransferase [Bifidobacterium tissieri]